MNFLGTLCIKLAFRFGFGDIFRVEEDGTDHYIAESGIVPDSVRSDEGRLTCAFDDKCSCQF